MRREDLSSEKFNYVSKSTMFLIHDCQQSTNTEEQLNVLNESFDSFSLKNLSSLQLVSELTNFDLKENHQHYNVVLEHIKVARTKWIASRLLPKNPYKARSISKALNKVFKNLKCLRKIQIAENCLEFHQFKRRVTEDV